MPDLALIATQTAPTLTYTPPPAVTIAVDRAPTPAAVGPTYTVIRHDTLWDLAEQYLGNHNRWHEIYDLNKRRLQPDGRTLVDANRIYPGWQLQLPSDATYSAAPVEAPAPVPVVQAPAPVAEIAPVEQAPTVVATQPQPAIQQVASDHVAHPRGESSFVIFASGSIVGTTFGADISAAVALLRARRRRLASLSAIDIDGPVVDSLMTEPVQLLRRHDIDSRVASGVSHDEAFPWQSNTAQRWRRSSPSGS